MSKDSHKIVSTWEKIAEYFPGFSQHQVRQRFGPEMKKLGVVYKGGLPGTKRPEPVIWGVVWKIEKYYDKKAKQIELGKCNALRTIEGRTKRFERLVDRMDDAFKQGEFDPNKIKRVVNLT